MCPCMGRSGRDDGLCLINERLARDGRSLRFGGGITEAEESESGDEGILKTICTRLKCFCAQRPEAVIEIHRLCAACRPAAGQCWFSECVCGGGVYNNM